MDRAVTANEFTAKFKELNEPNQRYIIAIQQALLYAQKQEELEKQKGADKKK